MEYVPGIIHEKLQTEIALEIRTDFNIPICIKRFSETLFMDNDTQTLSLKESDIIIIKWFKPNTSSMVYTYIDRVISVDGCFNVKRESTLSKLFVNLNIENMILFNDITKMFDRDKKINKLLDEMSL